MKKERARFNRSPFHLLLPDSFLPSSGIAMSSFEFDILQADRARFDAPAKEEERRAQEQPSLDQPSSKQQQIVGEEFAVRYEAEVATAAKMKDYVAIAAAHKESLFREAKNLHDSYDESLRDAHQMEAAAEQISSLLVEFARVIDAQSEQVTELRDNSSEATIAVQDTEKQLSLAVERSATHQRVLTTVILFLTLCILFLDWITP